MSEDYKVSKKKELLDLIGIYENDPVSYINNHLGEGSKAIRVFKKASRRIDKKF